MTTPLFIEPASAIAGDTITWKKSLPDYPANAGWTLHYRLINAAWFIDITASASGSDHLVNIPAATSAAYNPGKYDWQSYVTNAGGERYSIAVDSIEIKANWAALTAGLDTRSNARQILDALEAAWLVASRSRAYVAEYQIANRKMKFATKGEWIAEIDYWRREVAREDRAKKIAEGRPSGSKVFLRF